MPSPCERAPAEYAQKEVSPKNISLSDQQKVSPTNSPIKIRVSAQKCATSPASGHMTNSSADAKSRSSSINGSESTLPPHESNNVVQPPPFRIASETGYKSTANPAARMPTEGSTVHQFLSNLQDETGTMSEACAEALIKTPDGSPLAVDKPRNPLCRPHPSIPRAAVGVAEVPTIPLEHKMAQHISKESHKEIGEGSVRSWHQFGTTLGHDCEDAVSGRRDHGDLNTLTFPDDATKTISGDPSSFSISTPQGLTFSGSGKTQPEASISVSPHTRQEAKASATQNLMSLEVNVSTELAACTDVVAAHEPPISGSRSLSQTKEIIPYDLGNRFVDRKTQRLDDQDLSPLSSVSLIQDPPQSVFGDSRTAAEQNTHKLCFSPMTFPQTQERIEDVQGTFHTKSFSHITPPRLLQGDDTFGLSLMRRDEVNKTLKPSASVSSNPLCVAAPSPSPPKKRCKSVSLGVVLAAQCFIVSAAFAIVLAVYTAQLEDNYTTLVIDTVYSRQMYIRDTFAQFLVQRRQTLLRGAIQLERLANQRQFIEPSDTLTTTPRPTSNDSIGGGWDGGGGFGGGFRGYDSDDAVPAMGRLFRPQQRSVAKEYCHGAPQHARDTASSGGAGGSDNDNDDASSSRSQSARVFRNNNFISNFFSKDPSGGELLSTTNKEDTVRNRRIKAADDQQQPFKRRYSSRCSLQGHVCPLDAAGKDMGKLSNFFHQMLPVFATDSAFDLIALMVHNNDSVLSPMTNQPRSVWSVSSKPSFDGSAPPSQSLPISAPIPCDEGYLSVIPVNSRNTTFSSIFNDAETSPESPSYSSSSSVATSNAQGTASSSSSRGVSNPPSVQADSFLFQANIVALTSSMLGLAVSNTTLTLTRSKLEDWVLPVPAHLQFSSPYPVHTSFVMPQPLMDPETAYLWADPIPTILQSPGLFDGGQSGIYDSISFAFPLFIPMLRAPLNESHFKAKGSADDWAYEYYDDLEHYETSSNRSVCNISGTTNPRGGKRFRSLAAGGFTTSMLCAFIGTNRIKALVREAIEVASTAQSIVDGRLLPSWIDGQEASAADGHAPTTGTIEEIGQIDGLANLALLVWPSTGQIIMTTDPDVPDTRTTAAPPPSRNATNSSTRRGNAFLGAGGLANETAAPTAGLPPDSFDPLMPDPATLTKELWTLDNYPRRQAVEVYRRALERCAAEAEGFRSTAIARNPQLASPSNSSSNSSSTTSLPTQAFPSTQQIQKGHGTTACRRLVFDDAASGFIVSIAAVGDLNGGMYCHLLHLVNRKPFFTRLHSSLYLGAGVGVAAAVLVIGISSLVILSIIRPLLKLKRAIALAASFDNDEAEAAAYHGFSSKNAQPKKASKGSKRRSGSSRSSDDPTFLSHPLRDNNDADGGAGVLGIEIMPIITNVNTFRGTKPSSRRSNPPSAESRFETKDVANAHQVPAEEPIDEDHDVDYDDAGNDDYDDVDNDGNGNDEVAEGSDEGAWWKSAKSTKSSESKIAASPRHRQQRQGGQQSLEWYLVLFTEVRDVYDAFYRMNCQLRWLRGFVPSSVFAVAEGRSEGRRRGSEGGGGNGGSNREVDNDLKRRKKQSTQYDNTTLLQPSHGNDDEDEENNDAVQMNDEDSEGSLNSSVFSKSASSEKKDTLPCFGRRVNGLSTDIRSTVHGGDGQGSVVENNNNSMIEGSADINLQGGAEPYPPAADQQQQQLGNPLLENLKRSDALRSRHRVRIAESQALSVLQKTRWYTQQNNLAEEECGDYGKDQQQRTSPNCQFGNKPSYPGFGEKSTAALFNPFLPPSSLPPSLASASAGDTCKNNKNVFLASSFLGATKAAHSSHGSSVANGKIRRAEGPISSQSKAIPFGLYRATNISIRPSMRTKIAAVAYINVRNFGDLLHYGAACSQPLFRDAFGLMRRYVDTIEVHVGRRRGIVDSLHGDQLMATFNVARATSGVAARAAVSAMLGVMADLSTMRFTNQSKSTRNRLERQEAAGTTTKINRQSFDNVFGNKEGTGGILHHLKERSPFLPICPVVRAHSLSIGIASGPAQIAQTGTENTKKLSTLGPLVNEAVQLSRLARHIGQHILITNTVNDQLPYVAETALIGTVELPTQKLVPLCLPPTLSAPQSSAAADYVFYDNPLRQLSAGAGEQTFGDVTRVEGFSSSSGLATPPLSQATLAEASRSNLPKSIFLSTNIAGTHNVAASQSYANTKGGMSFPVQQQQQETKAHTPQSLIEILNAKLFHSVANPTEANYSFSNGFATLADRSSSRPPIIMGWFSLRSVREVPLYAIIGAPFVRHTEARTMVESEGKCEEWMYEIERIDEQGPAKLNIVMETYLRDVQAGGGAEAAKFLLRSMGLLPFSPTRQSAPPPPAALPELPTYVRKPTCEPISSPLRASPAAKEGNNSVGEIQSRSPKKKETSRSSFASNSSSSIPAPPTAQMHIELPASEKNQPSVLTANSRSPHGLPLHPKSVSNASGSSKGSSRTAALTEALSSACNIHRSDPPRLAANGKGKDEAHNDNNRIEWPSFPRRSNTMQPHATLFGIRAEAGAEAKEGRRILSAFDDSCSLTGESSSDCDANSSGTRTRESRLKVKRLTAIAAGIISGDYAGETAKVSKPNRLVSVDNVKAPKGTTNDRESGAVTQMLKNSADNKAGLTSLHVKSEHSTHGKILCFAPTMEVPPASGIEAPPSTASPASNESFGSFYEQNIDLLSPYVSPMSVEWQRARVIALVLAGNGHARYSTCEFGAAPRPQPIESYKI